MSDRIERKDRLRLAVLAAAALTASWASVNVAVGALALQHEQIAMTVPESGPRIAIRGPQRPERHAPRPDQRQQA